LPRSGYIILFVGGLKDTKGVYEMLDAFCRVRLTIPPSILKICGTGQEYASLKAIITERRLETCVTLVGAVEADEVAKWMQASDVLILPSYSEGMPNVVMEAMACGLPVISTRVGGLPEAVGSCKGAILIEPKNVEQLEEAMVRIAKDPDLQIRMSIAARQKAVAEFGAIPNTQKIIDFVGSVISNYKQ
jgi:glycosyltransferase involved in cell wall biosynthesis